MKKSKIHNEPKHIPSLVATLPRAIISILWPIHANENYKHGIQQLGNHLGGYYFRVWGYMIPSFLVRGCFQT